MTIRRASGLAGEAITSAIIAAFFEVYNRLGFGFPVDDTVIVEIKAGLALPMTGSRQLYNYLRGTDKEVGLLLHFGPEPRFYREYSPNSRKDLGSAESAVPVPIRDPLPDAGLAEMPVGDASKT